MRVVVASVAFVDVIVKLPACSGGIRKYWLLLSLLPSAESSHLRRHFSFLLLSLLLGFPPALVGVVVVAVEQTIYSI